MRQRRRAEVRRLLERCRESWVHLLTRLLFRGAVPGGTHLVGRHGERRTAILYRLLGYRIPGSNVAVGGGEIDLIATRGSLVVFVEVKTRTSEFASGWESVDPDKQKQLLRLAGIWLARNPGFEQVRFDVVSVAWVGREARVERFVDAFRADPHGQ